MIPDATSSPAALRQDAANRSLRTFAQGLILDVLVAIALVLGLSFSGASSWDDFEWTLLGFSLAKSVVQAVVAAVMRLKTGLLPPPGEVPGEVPGRDA